MTTFLALVVGAGFGGWAVYELQKRGIKERLEKSNREAWRDGWEKAMLLAKEDGWKPNQKVVKAKKKAKKKTKKGASKKKKK